MKIKQNDGRIEEKKKMLNVAALLVTTSRVIMFIVKKEAIVALKKGSKKKTSTGTLRQAHVQVLQYFFSSLRCASRCLISGSFLCHENCFLCHDEQSCNI